MSKAFTKETDAEEELEEADPLPAGVTNYMTPAGHAALQAELRILLREERPKVVEIVSWAAGNGDRSENGDYIYNKKRLREIDRRARYLTRRLDDAEIVDPRKQQNLDRVFFGAAVTYAKGDDPETTVQLVGVDEADVAHGKINWLSPFAQALMKRQAGDEFRFANEDVEIVAVQYPVPP